MKISLFYVFLFLLSLFHPDNHVRAQKASKMVEQKFDPETGEILLPAFENFDPKTGELKQPINKSLDFTNDRLTKRQIIELAKKDARGKHVGALWSVFGLTGLPTGIFGGIIGAVTFDEISEGTLAFPGFLFGGTFGISLPSLIAKTSSGVVKISYPPELVTDEERISYEKTYRSEAGVLRQKSAASGTLIGIVGFAGFILLLIAN